MRILFDLTLKKIGCPLLQAAYGGNISIPSTIKTENWFVEPTENMKLFEVDGKQALNMIFYLNKCKA